MVSNVWQILKKDARQFALYLMGLWALQAAFAVMVVSEVYRDSWRASITLTDLLSLAIPVVWVMLIALVVTGDPPVGENSFWLTRPYSRWELLGAKLLFIGAFVNLSWLISDCVILGALGLPVPLWELAARQLPLMALVAVPAFSLAALSRNMGQFALWLIGCVLGLLGAGFAQAQWFEGSNPNPPELDIAWVLGGITILLAVAALAYNMRLGLVARVLAAAVSAVSLFAVLNWSQLGSRGAFTLPRERDGFGKQLHSTDVRLRLEAPAGGRWRPIGESNCAVPVSVEGLPGSLVVSGGGRTEGRDIGSMSCFLFVDRKRQYHLRFYGHAPPAHSAYDLTTTLTLKVYRRGVTLSGKAGLTSVPGFGACRYGASVETITCWSGPDPAPNGFVINETNYTKEWPTAGIFDEVSQVQVQAPFPLKQLSWTLSPLRSSPIQTSHKPGDTLSFYSVDSRLPVEVVIETKGYPMAECWGGDRK